MTKNAIVIVSTDLGDQWEWDGTICPVFLATGPDAEIDRLKVTELPALEILKRDANGTLIDAGGYDAAAALEMLVTAFPTLTFELITVKKRLVIG
jgi:hypothetical protein